MGVNPSQGTSFHLEGEPFPEARRNNRQLQLLPPVKLSTWQQIIALYVPIDPCCRNLGRRCRRRRRILEAELAPQDGS